jgi:signal peptidase I
MGRSAATLPQQEKPRTKRTPAPQAREGHRDTAEAIVVAFILALGVRGFLVQAFVIPTGSMAPTLMGRHKEVVCPQCGFTYAVNASMEVDLQAAQRDTTDDADFGHGTDENGRSRVMSRRVQIPSNRVYAGVCVNCRYKARVVDEPSFSGDRILVMMFPYDLPFLPGSRPPSRWDVVVFRYPEDPETSYIKRLVGLPGETIRIAHGDVYVKQPGADTFVRARKPMYHQAATQINVYDDRYRPKLMVDRPEWKRWKSPDGAAVGWKAGSGYDSRFEASAVPASEWAELRYQHLVPDAEQWGALVNDRQLPRPPRATLVTDFYSYNTSMMAPAPQMPAESLEINGWRQPHWVGDLTVETTLEIKDAKGDGAVRLELVKGGILHRCTINIGSGEAVFTRGNDELGRAETPIKGIGQHRVAFGNVDDRMTLVVDGREVGGEGFAYDLKELVPMPTAADLSPAAVAVKGASVAASDLVLKRDIYYTQDPGSIDYGSLWRGREPRDQVELFDFLSDPSRFVVLGDQTSHDYDYEIAEDHYFMLGDNSPQSKDSRGWGTADTRWSESDRKSWEVPRELLTGKAFFIFRPHSVPFGFDLRLNTDFPLLVRPYFERMRWIR